MSPALRRLKALLALARGSEGPEGVNAQAKAEAYAAKHGLNVADAAIDAGSVQDAVSGSTYVPGNSALWRASLGWKIAGYCGVSMVRHGAQNRWTVIGSQADIALWTMFFERTVAQIDAEAARFVRDLPPWASARTEGDTFRKSAARGFAARLAEHKAESAEAATNQRATADVVPDGPTYAMVLVGRELAVKAGEQRMFPKLGTTTIKSSGSGSTRTAGYAFGKGLGVHKAEVGGAS